MITVSQVGEFHRLDGFCLDKRAFERHLMGERHGSRAVGSGRGDENLQMERLFQAGKVAAGLIRQP